ncbi:MAG: hypothetical protein IEMM0002_1136 [bacterium]|nr:MAG: hypothetical protein IEMM0002_1136 [bacterium]
MVSGWRGSDEYYDALIRTYGRKMIKNPRSYAFVSMANTCLKAKKPKMALEVLKKGMEHHPNLLSAHLCRAKIYIEINQLGRAMDMLVNIIDQKPENLHARKLMAFIHLKVGRPEEGLEQIDEIKKIEPYHPPPAILSKKLLALQELHKKRVERRKMIVSTLEQWLSNSSSMLVKSG